MNFLKFLDPQIILAIIIVALISTFSGCMYGKHSANVANEAAKNEKLISDLTDARSIEHKANESQNNVSDKYEKEITSLRDRANSAEFQLDRLRVKARTCPSVPTIGTGTGKSNATAEDATNGAATGEVNLDEVAREVKQLGLDVDSANVKIIGLQELVKTYQSVCGKTVE